MNCLFKESALQAGGRRIYILSRLATSEANQALTAVNYSRIQSVIKPFRLYLMAIEAFLNVTAVFYGR